MEQLPEELKPKEDGCFYKKHADHPGFNPPPELKAVLDSPRKAAEQNAASRDNAGENRLPEEGQLEVKVDSTQ
jgi:hypothetical protein